MRSVFPVLLILSLAACGESPPPAPPAKPAAPTAAAPAAPAPQATAPESPKPDANRELAARVKRALEDEAKIQAGGIDVTANDGVVTLWGSTTSNDERARAAGIAAKVEGVKSVENKLSVVRGS